MSALGIKIEGGINIGGGISIGAGGSSPAGPYTVPFADGIGAPGNFVWIGASLSNTNIVTLISLGDLTGWTVTASDNPSLTGIITAMNPVGYWGIAESPGIPYAPVRNLIFSH